MSEFDVAQLAVLLSAELGLPYTTVRWSCPFGLGAGLTPALRRAIQTLTREPRGGLLVVHLDHSRSTPDPIRTQAALLATLSRTHITDTQTVPCTNGLAIVCTLAPVRRLSSIGDLAPVEGADLSMLRPDAALKLAPLARPAELDTDDDFTPDERVLVATGAATLCDDSLAPTVAGMVAFGTAPATFLGGLHAILEGDKTTRLSGDPLELARSVSRALNLREPIDGVIQILVLHALLERSWVPHLDDDPLYLLAAGPELELRWPACIPDRSPANPILRRLLRTRSAQSVPTEAPARIDRWLRARGSLLDLDREVDTQIARLRLPKTRPPKHIEPPPAAKPRTRLIPEPPPPPEPIHTEEPPIAPPPSPHLPADARRNAVLALFERRDTLSARDVMQELGWTRSTTRDILARLVTAGTITGTATSARSPHQTYILKRPPEVGPRD